MDDGPSGIAEVLATAMNTSLTGLERAGVVSARGGKTHLLARSELQANCDPVTDTRTPVWEVTQHLIKRLDEGGELTKLAAAEPTTTVSEPRFEL